LIDWPTIWADQVMAR